VTVKAGAILGVLVACLLLRVVGAGGRLASATVKLKG
jgi:hypothetical protein